MNTARVFVTLTACSLQWWWFYMKKYTAVLTVGGKVTNTVGIKWVCFKKNS